MRRAARYLAISSKKSLCALKKNESAGAKSSMSRPRARPQRTYSSPSASVKASSCAAVDSGFADVVAADADRVPLGHVLRAELDRVGHQAHRRRRREDELFLRDVLLEDVVLDRAAELIHRHALLLGGGDVHRPDDGRWRVDRHAGRRLCQWGCRRAGFPCPSSSTRPRRTCRTRRPTRARRYPYSVGRSDAHRPSPADTERRWSPALPNPANAQVHSAAVGGMHAALILVPGALRAGTSGVSATC